MNKIISNIRKELKANVDKAYRKDAPGSKKEGSCKMIHFVTIPITIE